MDISKFFEENKKKITDQWYDSTIANYPSESGKFLNARIDRFSNPIGYTHGDNLPIIFDEILKGETSPALTDALEQIIRLRAVQEFTASQAVGFMFQLKTVLRENFDKIAGKKADAKDLLDFESQIDGVALLGFDLYMKMKEKIYTIKSSEQKKTFSTMVERLNKKYERYDEEYETK
jgi:hypothetical protein